MAEFIIFIFSLTIALQTRLFPGEARKVTITHNCSYTVWPGLSSRTVTTEPFLSPKTRIHGHRAEFELVGPVVGLGKLTALGLTRPQTTLVELALRRQPSPRVQRAHHRGSTGGNGSRCLVTGCANEREPFVDSTLFEKDFTPAFSHQYNPRKIGMAAIRGMIILAIFASLASVTFCVSGTATFYTEYSPSTCYGYEDQGKMIAAVSSDIYQNVAACGRMYTVRCTNSPSCRGGNVTVKVVDLCPGSSANGFDLSQEAFSIIADPTLAESASATTSTNMKKQHLPIPVLVAVPTSTALLIMLCFGIWICKKKKKTTEREKAEIEDIRPMESFQFDINTIIAATTNFSVDNKLGEGGFGEVYKGKLENGQEVAIKRLLQNSKQGVIEFKTEVVLVAKLQHKNLVKLLGFCMTPREKILVYEFLPNSSLDKFLFDPSSNAPLDWQTRLNIIIGIARGLMYLHEDSRLTVIHRDLKTSNILLDGVMNPKISDFGLAKLFGEDQTHGDTKRIVGTYGYMAPEYAITGHYSVKSDVYSFGVIVLEIISGKKNRFFGGLQCEEALLHRAWRLWNQSMSLDFVDPKLNNDFPTEEVTRCFRIGLLCIQEDAIRRPAMRSILDALSNPSGSLPNPNPPRFFGNPSIPEDHHSLPCTYTGTQIITDLYSRD